MSEPNLVYEVVSALAAADGVSPEDVDYNLSNHVDPDVLMTLGTMDHGEWEFTFRVADHEVSVANDQPVVVDGVAYRERSPVSNSR